MNAIQNGLRGIWFRLVISDLSTAAVLTLVVTCLLRDQLTLETESSIEIETGYFAIIFLAMLPFAFCANAFGWFIFGWIQKLIEKHLIMCHLLGSVISGVDPVRLFQYFGITKDTYKIFVSRCYYFGILARDPIFRQLDHIEGIKVAARNFSALILIIYPIARQFGIDLPWLNQPFIYLLGAVLFIIWILVSIYHHLSLLGRMYFLSYHVFGMGRWVGEGDWGTLLRKMNRLSAERK